MTRFVRALDCALLLCAAQTVAAAGETRADVDAWLQTTPAAMPAPGTVITQADLESVKALIPPGFYDYVNHPNVQLEIQATTDIQPHQVFLDATAAHGHDATLNADGSMNGYVAGRPFDPETFDDVTPQEAGMMIAWNNNHRWQYYGYKLDTLDMTYVQPTADGSGGDPTIGMEGGGTVERKLVQEFHRVYLNHLAMLPGAEYKVHASNSDKRYFKDYISFVEPFDVQGTTFVVERALDPQEEDQVNSYLPTQRRVRRVSAEERADSFMGSNYTLDDFEGFSGRVMDYEWTYLGQKQVLHVSDSKQPQLRFSGTQSNVAIDRWQVRTTFVVELKPRWSGHPMSAKLLFVDSQTFTPTHALVFNREGKLWRMVMTHYQIPTMDTSTVERSLETSVPIWRGSIGVDFLVNTTTLARATSDTIFPTMAEREIERRFNLSTLTEGR